VGLKSNLTPDPFSFDHRLIDGALGSVHLEDQAALENFSEDIL
jgi:hypothetical protein